MEIDDRRKFKRVPAAAVLEVRALSEADLKSEPTSQPDAETLDLSGGGLLLTTDSELRPGSLVSVRLDLDSIYDLNVAWTRGDHRERGKSVGAVGRVVRIKGAQEIGFEIAIEFVEIAWDDAEVLRGFIGNE